MDGEGVEQLRAELEAMKLALQKEREERLAATVSSSSSQPSSTMKQVFVAAGRRLERFRGNPEKASDPLVQEWVSDVKGQLTARQLQGDD